MLRFFEVRKGSQNFSPLRSVGFCLRLGPGAPAPEASHRCIWQLRRVTSGSSSGFSRPVSRTLTAVASDEDLRGDTFLRQRNRCEEVDEMLIQYVFIFCGYSFHFCVENMPKHFVPSFFVLFCDQNCFVSLSLICFLR